ncbi:SDR family oxidoreductase [Nocardia camponoti]|uniref:NAD(P)-binding domain-containing protein n=1 Tax=Nocardia camponoti TaxID=1616106 RepID=A0A917V569_9NOCA|nr:NAD(P)H-binding protein [Nocardia camponoti]GGK39334.1 hypothetical protein GCM10011591_08730 [Nocardia camponoti]
MIIVTGATGNIGSALITSLAESGEDVRAVSRGARPVELPAGVDHAVADLGDLTSFASALTGGDALFLLITGEQLMTGPDPVDVVKAAAAAGISRAVFVSSQGAVTRPGVPGYARSLAFERAFGLKPPSRGSGLGGRRRLILLGGLTLRSETPDEGDRQRLAQFCAPQASVAML